MSDGSRFASPRAWQRLSIGRRLAGIAFVFELFAPVVHDDRHRRLPQRIMGIFIGHFEELGRTSADAVAAAVATIGVDRDEKITGGVRVTVIRQHRFFP